MQATSPVTVQVRVGSLGDPDDLPGLAHFTEHMLFYASEKYPQEDEYSKFVVSMPCTRASCLVTQRLGCFALVHHPIAFRAPHTRQFMHELQSENGGSTNAYTSSESTNYHFDVNQEHLEGALDRFAQFFISPTISQDGVEREVNAVDSE